MNNNNKLNAATGVNFASIYPHINLEVLRNGIFQASRYGDTLELDEFKTKVQNPIERCVGGQRRDINIFFLLAEAMWIWVGAKDVKFLSIFNSRMSEFSDDGETFHAPYGFRLRKWGLDSRTQITMENRHAYESFDQIRRAIEKFVESPETRRVALSIWNPELDLQPNQSTKDTPCNDLLFLKIRDNKLKMTICNRSNDLHWGLPTNVFQFSWILEVMAHILGVEVGTQTHLSDSLHIYTNNPANKIHEIMRDNWQDMPWNLYNIVDASKMSDQNIIFRDSISALHYYDTLFAKIIGYLTKLHENQDKEKPTFFPSELYENTYFTVVTALLSVYVCYSKTERKDANRLKACFSIMEILRTRPTTCVDYQVLALNWFFNRLKDEEAVRSVLSQLETMELQVPELNKSGIKSIIGKL